MLENIKRKKKLSQNGPLDLATFARPARPGQGRGRILRGIWHKVLQPLFIVGPGPDQRKHKHGRYYSLIIKIMKISLRVFNKC